jgi:DNA-binding NarL/FixJ family response regulator
MVDRNAAKPPQTPAQTPPQTPPQAPLSVLLVDASEAFARSLVDCLALLPQVRLVGCARHVQEALALEQQLRPDVVLLDFVLDGDMQGLALARRLRAAPEPAQLVFVSLHDGLAYAEEAATVGARGLVSKRHLLRDLIPMLQTLAATRRRHTDSSEPQEGDRDA